MTDDECLHAVLMKIRYDLTAAQGKLTEAIRIVASLDLGEVGKRAACPSCGATFPGPQTLAEHLYTSHGGPVPAHWLRVDELVTLEPIEVPPPGPDREIEIGWPSRRRRA